MNLYIKVGSITNAQRGQKILRQGGYKTSIKKVDNPVKNDGCGYMLVVNSVDDSPVNLLKMQGIEVRGVEKNDLS